MDLVDFRDTCRIERETGQTDEYDNPVTDTLYEGPCLYEEGGQSYSSRMIVFSPVIYLPSNKVLILINDIINVTTSRGRPIRALAERVRDIKFKFKNVEVTRIELKQAMGE